MKFFTKTAALTASLAMMAVPALAAGPAGTTGGSTNAHRLAAPGQYCKTEGKKHVAGQKGTPFSLCVRAQRKLRSGDTTSPRVACEGESKRHVAGQKGTPFSKCVSAGAKLMRDEQAQDETDTTPAA